MDKVNPVISVKYSGDRVLATLTSEKILDEEDVRNLEVALLPLVDQIEGIKLVIDFSHVKFLSSSVLGLLIRISKKIYGTKGALKLCCIDAKIMEVFKITRLNKIFEIFDTLQKAENSF